MKKKHDDYNSILTKALADRLAEAFAEYLHLEIRRNYWGYDSLDNSTENSLDKTNFNIEDLIKEKYVGIRPAPGYPACPDHTEKKAIFEFLDVTKEIGLELTESMAMLPAASVSGLYFAHKDANYFGLGLVSKDQVEDYAKRKNMKVEVIEKWLGPNLNY